MVRYDGEAAHYCPNDALCPPQIKGRIEHFVSRDAMNIMSGAERVNPLLIESKLPFGAPDFNVINEADYLPAIEAAVKIQRDNIKKIVNSKETPTFANTILPYEESGVLLDRISNVFFGLTSAPSILLAIFCA